MPTAAFASSAASAFLSAFVFGLVAVNAWVSWRVARSPLYRGWGKVAQVGVVWLVPMVGALLILGVLETDPDEAGPRRLWGRDASLSLLDLDGLDDLVDAAAGLANLDLDD